MTQPTPQSTFKPQPIATVFKFLRDYILAAASGDRNSVFHLVAAVFASARAAVRCLAEHYNTHPRQRTLDTYARLKYCLTRIPAIFYTLQHAPERFLTAAQLRALTHARAVLAHIWRQPVDFAPLTPWLTAPENCPPPPRSAASPALGAPLRTPRSALHSSAAPRSALHTAPADPLLIHNPGRALAAVLLQLAAIYGVAPAPVAVPRPAATVPSENPAPSEPPIPAPLSPRSALHTPHFPQPPP